MERTISLEKLLKYLEKRAERLSQEPKTKDTRVILRRLNQAQILESIISDLETGRFDTKG